MNGTLNSGIAEAAGTAAAGLALPAIALEERQETAERTACYHCGEPCPDLAFRRESKIFCCQGCLVVHDLLAESGLEQFYDLNRHPGVRIRQTARREQWAYLDDPALQQQLLDFTDGKLSRVTLHVPAVHCLACVWLLENLFRLHPGIGRSQVNFPRREVSIAFAPAKAPLSEVVTLLASLGYEPRLTLGELGKARAGSARTKQWLQVGIAGFAFGNVMLFSLPLYLGLDSFSGPVFQRVFGWLSLLLTLPVLAYSASDYWRSAWVSVRRRSLTLDVPIALGLAALYARSAFEILSGRGEGYLDSLAGLVFFLLCGRLFQQKTHERMAFDLDYKCFFPLSATRITGRGEESVAISNLAVGDRLRLRNGELIPADARLLSGPAVIDYSFVTGESDPVARSAGDYLYAGGKQAGGAIEIEIVKPVSQSYLTSLWGHEAFQKQRESGLDTLTNRYSGRFTKIVIAVALGAALLWAAAGDADRGIKALVSVLIVACPCALALAAPFTLGTAQRLLGRAHVFLKNAHVLERLARVDAIVFDKTGTLTAAQSRAAVFHGATPLTTAEAGLVHALARHSAHPHAVRIAESLAGGSPAVEPSTFAETPGCGVEGVVAGRQLRLGSRAWLEQNGVAVPKEGGNDRGCGEGGGGGDDKGCDEGCGEGGEVGSESCLAIDGVYRGAFGLAHGLRPRAGRLIERLAGRFELALLSGDNEKERESFRHLFGSDARLHFNQSPLDKLGFIRGLQEQGRTVMMVGDGLNDAGALRQSDVGVAVVEQTGMFSPASDVILRADQVPHLAEILALARSATRVVRLGFGVSAIYNVAGVSIAAAGILSPLICAVLMPLSSLSVVLFACGMTRRAARKAGLPQ